MGTTGIVVLPTKSSWTRASAAAVALVAGVVASVAGSGRPSGDAAARMPVYADGSVVEGTTSLPPVAPSASGPEAVDEVSWLVDASVHQLGVNRRKSTVPATFCRSSQIYKNNNAVGL